MKVFLCSVVFLLALLVPSAICLDNGLGSTPPMGWNSWNAFWCNINETLIKEIADVMISSGLADAGYEYLNLDDCWAYSRDLETYKIIPDPVAFPSGMEALGNYIHGLGLKFGIYSDAGLMTCGKRPGSLFFEIEDAQSYASWGVDYLKYDNCYNASIAPQVRYPRMRDALNSTGRPIFFSMCEWGLDQPWNWAKPISNSWRTAMDIGDNWPRVMEILYELAPYASLGGPHGWNDPDMLEVGNTGMTTTEYESHFALWAFLKAPLLIGCDIRNMSNDTKRILMNTEIIAINQDPLGIPATLLQNNSNYQIWVVL